MRAPASRRKDEEGDDAIAAGAGAMQHAGG
jgi:hypothetical protein